MHRGGLSVATREYRSLNFVSTPSPGQSPIGVNLAARGARKPA